MDDRPPNLSPILPPILPPAPGPAGPLVRPQHLGGELRRSSIPKVIGILAIVFASLGILGSLAVTFGLDDELRKYGVTRADLGGFGTWMTIYMLLGTALFGVHLAAGILSVRYSPVAPSWMTFYGIFALVLIVADVAISMTAFPGGAGFMHEKMYEDLVYPRFGLTVLALPWPIIALAMINQRSARLACGPQAQA